MEINYNIKDIDAVASRILETLTSKIILLDGDMGAGKTTLIKALVVALGSNDIVSSPTFSIVNEYKLENDSIYHFDLYRIEDETEALNFGFEDYLYSNNWLLIEWPEKIQNLLDDNVNVITITANKDTSRSLKLSQKLVLTQ
ncbi:tRNA (adenosine(37)-N6)-threonylcarbamoyltransferase complex ATPase subunit type 1 TsaE [Ichthyenterobacterium magnum]|uniref:tRNA threonylcarbamoyladenosine biosynthesis protein TsaE n=1 Tax=Ichthyenterobacterium magnum TaxID=1230530 RepID=A0A420DMD2_9FLAO|nr:tRNA threonylcarbamoyladenosine biosynthesis protein TsaE [Ichthyenterobacterium magnum]